MVKHTWITYVATWPLKLVYARIQIKSTAAYFKCHALDFTNITLRLPRSQAAAALITKSTFRQYFAVAKKSTSVANHPNEDADRPMCDASRSFRSNEADKA